MDRTGLIELLDIVTVTESPGLMVMEMPVSAKVLQPFGYLHGGANVVLAESAASMGAAAIIEEDEITFGMEINANHIKTKQSGILTATARCRHQGRSTQIWEIEITDEEESLVCLSRCTMAVKKKR
ncbi:PaaI family thioesterase [Salinicoccus hispanicus]|uniref:Hotdog fold thioesterase n=1 Tax=Salinicoccus hispanicus TaxID=157225 RepID=A0A6N8U0I8_9STAP|nr:hotdog fold thioesterase [Salinicoccus hispanicus]MXQ50817.1 hotdog fold thioesterase [Salinicoccus hispanicus]